MPRFASSILLCLLVCGLAHTPAHAQTFEAVGTRPAGMGGAFVAVADDASAVYWNPAGLALGGAFFSLVLDGMRAETNADELFNAGKQSSALIAMSTPPLGATYYRLSTIRVTTPAILIFPPPVAVERLTTHHAGVTLVQSVTSSFALASTLKAVRGIAASGTVLDGNRDDLLDTTGVLADRATTRFSADVGAMATLGTLRAGVTIRNITEPDFNLPQGGAIELKRQSRAGIAYFGVPDLIVAADVDIERNRGLVGDVRNLAAGAELRLAPRAVVRGGLRVNTLSDQPGGHAPIATLGGTFATVRSLLVDGQVTLGSTAGDRGWGIAARFVY